MEKIFQKLLKSGKEGLGGSFEERLFTSTQGYFPELDRPVLDGDTTERVKVTQALKTYVENKPEKKAKIGSHQIQVTQEQEIKELIIPDSFSEADFLAEQKLSQSTPYFDQSTVSGRPLILFIADAPRPFKEGEYIFRSFNGESAKLMEKMIQAMKVGDNFSTALMSYKPLELGAYDPTTDLADQFPEALVTAFKLKPELIITLGAQATNLLLGRKEKLSSVHGQFYRRNLLWQGQQVPVTFSPLFHPEYLLINGNMKKTAWNDMQKMMKFVGLL